MADSPDVTLKGLDGKDPHPTVFLHLSLTRP
jgi:hypothetical protein